MIQKYILKNFTLSRVHFPRLLQTAKVIARLSLLSVSLAMICQCPIKPVEKQCGFNPRFEAISVPSTQDSSSESNDSNSRQTSKAFNQRPSTNKQVY